MVLHILNFTGGFFWLHRCIDVLALLVTTANEALHGLTLSNQTSSTRKPVTANPFLLDLFA